MLRSRLATLGCSTLMKSSSIVVPRICPKLNQSNPVMVADPAMMQKMGLSTSALCRSAESASTADHNEAKEAIYIEAMKFVNEHGWSRKTLSLGAEAAGYEGVAEGLFKGGDELVIYFIQDCNEQLVEYLEEMEQMQKNPETKIPITNFIRNAVEFRLRLIIPHIKQWPQGLALLHSPRVIRDTVSISSKMVDDIWYYAGDRSTDLNWYTKRALLAKLYASTQLVLINDQSPDFRDTWDFLDRRLDDIKVMGSVARSLSSVPKSVSKVATSGISSVLNIVGLGQKKR